MGLLLRNLSWQKSGEEGVTADVRIDGQRIADIGESLAIHRSDIPIDFSGHFIYPSMINAHDHLEMNLYTRLGSPYYSNYVDWSRDIYHPKLTPIREIQSIDIRDRLLWGGVKNMISGVATVVHHNPWHRVLGTSSFPVRVMRRVAWSHSLALSKDVVADFPPKGKIPFVIHAAEGIDDFARAEIPKLDSLGLLRSNTVLVHGVGINERQAGRLAEQECALVWCPSSNAFMFNQTAPIEILKEKINIALGTDSTLTGTPSLFEEMRAALVTGKATEPEIWNMVTDVPARIFNLPAPRIEVNSGADIFIAPIKNHNYYSNVFELNPSDIVFALTGGKPTMMDPGLGAGLDLKHSVRIGGTEKKSAIDISSLKNRIRKKVDERILQQNPLWTLIDT